MKSAIKVTATLFCMASMVFLSGCGGAPKKEEVTNSLKKIMPVNFEVLSVDTMKDIPGLYEVAVRADKQTMVLYVDKKVKYVVSGSVIDLNTKQNLTLESQKKLEKK